VGWPKPANIECAICKTSFMPRRKTTKYCGWDCRNEGIARYRSGKKLKENPKTPRRQHVEKFPEEMTLAERMMGVMR